MSGGAIAGIVIASVLCWCPALLIAFVVILIPLSPFICMALIVCSPCIAVGMAVGATVSVLFCITLCLTCLLYSIYTLDVIGLVQRYQAKRKDANRVEQL